MEYNMVGWFEIPVRDMDRAKKFYEEVFQISIQVQNFNELLMGWFPWAEGKNGCFRLPGLARRTLYTQRYRWNTYLFLF